ncbi:MAG: TonB-dependent receptor [Planctomycetaceae bacterium]|nr:TonB-dependent receptor [Planctomycetaceae bacterium]
MALNIRLTAVILTLGGLSAPLAAQEPKPAEQPAERIVIEAPSREERDPFEMPDAFFVLGREPFLRFVPEDLGSSMSQLPGAYIQRTAAGQASPFVRGMTGKQLLLTIDGVRFSNAAFRDGPNQYFASIDSLFVERIEVLRGPFSVLYGSDALGGMVNVVTRRPQMNGGFHPGIIGQYTSANRGLRGSADLPFGFSEFAGYATVTKSDYDNLTGGPSIGEQPFTGYDDYSFTNGLTWRLAADWTMDWRFQHKTQRDVFRTDKNTTLVANPALLPLDGGGNPISQDALNIFPAQDDTFSTVTFRHSGFDVVDSLNVTLMYHRMNEELHRIPQGSTTRREQFFVDQTFGVIGSAILDFGAASRITTGFDLYYDTIESGRDDVNTTTGAVTENDARAQFPDGANYLAFGMYAQDEIMLMDGWLELRPGVRFSLFSADAETSKFSPLLDDVSETFTDVTGALAVMAHPAPWITPTVSIGRGFRAPNLDDLSANKATGAGNEIPNPDLEPEELIGIQAGAKVRFENEIAGSAAPERFSGDAYYFEHLMFDAIVKTPTIFDGAAVVQLNNTNRARIRGWEASATWYVGPELAWFGLSPEYIFTPGDSLAVWANATWTRGDDLSAKMPFSRIPPFIANAGMRYDIGGVYIEPSMQLMDKQDRYAPANNGDVRFAQPHTPGFTIYNLAAGWRPNEHWSFRMAINNITDKNYQILGSGVFGSGTDARLSAELRW